MMKRLFAWLLCLCLLGVSGAVAEGEALKLSDVTSEGSYAVKLARVLRVTAPSELAYHNYCVQQGSATDGRYAYIVMEDQIQHLGSIRKFDMSTWEEVKVQYGLPIDHGNDMTYNAKTGKLVVVNNAPRRNLLTIIDPETLEVVETVTCSCEMFSIAYNETRDVYVVGLSGGENFSILNADFEEIAFHAVVHDGLVTQGADCDDNYIYFPRWNRDNKEVNMPNLIAVYDWDGNHVTNIRVGGFQEVESMFHVGDDFYLAFNASGSYVYKATLKLQ